MRLPNPFNRHRRKANNATPDQVKVETNERIVKEKVEKEPKMSTLEQVPDVPTTNHMREKVSLAEIVMVNINVNNNEKDLESLETRSTECSSHADTFEHDVKSDETYTTDGGSSEASSSAAGTIVEASTLSSGNGDCISSEENSLREQIMDTTDAARVARAIENCKESQEALIRQAKVGNDIAKKVLSVVLEQVAEKGGCFCQEVKGSMNSIYDIEIDDYSAHSDSEDEFTDNDDSTVGSLNSGPRMFM